MIVILHVLVRTHARVQSLSKAGSWHYHPFGAATSSAEFFLSVGKKGQLPAHSRGEFGVQRGLNAVDTDQG